MKRLALLLLFSFVSSGHAQLLRIDPGQRYEVGQRLRLFERVLEKHNDEKARKRALPFLEKTTPTFFSGKLGEVGRLLDQARLALLSEMESTDEQRWADSLMVSPATRLLDSSETKLPLRVEAFYKVEAKLPARAALRLTLAGNKASVELKELPIKYELAIKDMKEGDYLLQSEILVNGKTLARGEQTISVVADLAGRLKALEPKAKALEAKEAKGPEKPTLTAHLATLKDLAARKTPETNFPASALLGEAEGIADALKEGKGYFGPDRPGGFWLRLGDEAVRVQIPKGLKKDRPVPLVVAMHGAGGSENLFFDGYGGKVTKLCGERGWLVVATRSPLFSLSGPDVVKVVDELAKLYPVDRKKVFLVGHSMGAGQAVALAARRPERIAAVAALGSGGGFKESDGMKAVPFFVGIGDHDFALSGAKGLRTRLEKAGVKKVVFKEYNDVEHLAIVQLALADVFAFFDEAAKRHE